MPSRARWLRALSASALALGVLAPAASADRNFAVRFTANTQGNITLTGNTLMTCPASPDCEKAKAGTGTNLNNNGWAMTRVDRDQDPLTSTSSSARLTLPANAEVLFAALYYGGRDRENSPDRNRVKLAVVSGTGPCTTPANPTYQTLAPAVVDDAVDVNGNKRMFQGFVEVTALVKAVGPGCYTVGGVPLTTDQTDPFKSDHSGGWALVVAYKDASETARNLTVFDGMKFVTTLAEGGKPVDIPLSGFQTPPLGDVNTSVGVVAYEGDLANTGDSVTLDGDLLSNSLNPQKNFFNASISLLDTSLTQRDPAPLNQLGYDADILKAPVNTLANNQTSTAIRLQTDGDGYAPGAVTFATDLYAPRLETTKTATPQGAAQAGDRLAYTMSVKNTGLDAAVNAVLTDPLPSGSTFAPGSLRIGGQPQTDAADGDAAEYDASKRQVVFRLGRLAAQAADWQATVSFDVIVNEGLHQGATLVNVGTVGYTAATLGSHGEIDTPPVTTPVLVPDLAIVKTHLDDFAAGRTTTFRVVVSNVGEVPSRGTVTVTDTLKPQFSFSGGVQAPGWQCATKGRMLSCTRSDPLAKGDSYPAIEFAVRVDPDTEDEELFNTAVVAGGGDGNELNNQSTDSGKLRRPDLAVDKVADQQVVHAGGPATFTIRVANVGSSPASGVKLVDTLPAGLTLLSVTTSQGTCVAGAAIVCDLGELAVGKIVTVRLITLVAPDLAGSPPLVNRVRVDLNERDPNPGNNEDEASVDEVRALVDLVVEKFTATPTVPAGSTVAFTITVKNRGSSEARNVRLQDALPAGLTIVSAEPTQGSCTTGVPTTCALGNLPFGGSAQVVVVATSDAALAGQTLTNVVEAFADQTDNEPADNRASANVTLTPPPQPGPPVLPSDVSVTKTASPATLIVGQVATFTIVATNNGPGPAANMVVTDTPNGPVVVVSVDPSQGLCTTSVPITCQLGEIPAGGHATVVVRVIPLLAGPLGNGASALAPTDGAIAVASVSAVAPATSVRITKRASRSSVGSGGTVTFALRVTTSGRRTARNLRVCDQLPSGLAFARVRDATVRGSRVCWNLTALLPGKSHIFTLVTRATPTTRTASVTNHATVSGTNFSTRVAQAGVRITAAAGPGVTG